MGLEDHLEEDCVDQPTVSRVCRIEFNALIDTSITTPERDSIDRRGTLIHNCLEAHLALGKKESLAFHNGAGSDWELRAFSMMCSTLSATG